MQDSPLSQGKKRIQIDNDDFYIDLLFYNRKLKRLVAIDLKLGNFRHEYKSQAVSMLPNTSPYYHPKNYFKQNSNNRSRFSTSALTFIRTGLNGNW
nr:PDDEXK nuclease domain-containing protein [Pseudanabaena sp. 'Roaring Creek']